jgi:hypothetical protein
MTGFPSCPILVGDNGLSRQFRSLKWQDEIFHNPVYFDVLNI